MNGIIGTLSIWGMLLPASITTIPFILAMGLIHMVTFAFNDVLVDSLMVNEAKKDKKSGSEDL